MPIATDSGYLPEVGLREALLRTRGLQCCSKVIAPTGLFSETAASPSPAVGLLSSLPQFTGVNPGAPAFQGGNAPNGPLPDQSPTFSYMSPTPPWGGSGPSNSYPSMTMPQDPGPMNIGPGGAAPSFTGVSPNAPFTANGPTRYRISMRMFRCLHGGRTIRLAFRLRLPETRRISMRRLPVGLMPM
jgi:hypothetical protein